MATIAQTLLDIGQAQRDIQLQLNEGKVQLTKFIEDIMVITRVYQFDLLAHSSLDGVKTELSGTAHPLLLKYRALSQKPDMHEEYIRWLNIGGLFIVCSIFEKFVREAYGRICQGAGTKHLRDAYKKILQSKGIDNSTASRMVREFNLIRFIRNSFYQGGVYTHPKAQKFVLGDETYELVKGKPVKPIRLMTAINIFWRHYATIMKK
jgi:hypothetical protein